MIKLKIAVNKLSEKIKQLDSQSPRLQTHNPSLIASYKINNARVDIYSTGTIIIQGGTEKSVASRYFEENLKEYASTTKVSVSEIPEEKLIRSNKAIIGCDEVGTGDYFGGISVCASLVNKDHEQWLISLGVKDSKQLNDRLINVIAQQISARVKYCCITANPEEYNSLYEKCRNANAIKAILHNRALICFKNKYPEIINASTIVMDQFTPKETYYKHLTNAKINEQINITKFETKAEAKYLSVAVASILARKVWLDDMARLSELAGFTLHRGSSSPIVLNQAKKLFNRGGIELIKKFVKLHFSYTNGF